MEGHSRAWLTGAFFICFYQKNTYVLEKEGSPSQKKKKKAHCIHTLDKQTVLLQALINSFVYSEKD